jgi:hypothetical protein
MTKNFDIKINTKSDQTGAKQTTQSLDQLANKTDGLTKKSTGFSGMLSKGFKSLLSPIGLATAAVGAFAAALAGAAKLLNEFGKQEVIDKKQEALIRATGGAAGYSAAQLKEMAAALSETTSESDESVAAAQNLLLTFKNIRGEAFERTIETALDMGAVLGGTESAALQLGKALENPAVGLTYLRRSGVSFTDQQMKQIKALQEQNKLFEAQTLILDELQTQFGGAAAAAGSGWTGATKRLSNAWGDLKQAMGGAIASTGLFQGAASVLTDSLRDIEDGIKFSQGANEEFKVSLAGLKDLSDDSLGPVAADADSAAEKLEKAQKAAEDLQTAMASIENARLGLKLAQIDQQVASGDMSKTDAQAAKNELRIAYNVRETKGKISVLESTKQAMNQDVESKGIQAGEAVVSYQTARDDYNEKYSAALGKFDKPSDLVDAVKRLENAYSILWKTGKGTNEEFAKITRALKQARTRLNDMEALRELPAEIEKLKQDAEKKLAAYYDAKESAQTENVTIDARKEALQTKLNTLEVSGDTNIIEKKNADRKAREEAAEKARKKAEERDKNMKPGERMRSMINSVEPVYVDPTGQQVHGQVGEAAQRQAREAIRAAGSAIMAGKDDNNIIFELSEKLLEISALQRKGFSQLFSQLDKLDGEVELNKSILKKGRT